MYSIRQRFLAEVLGTAALVLVGPGSVIATLTLAGKAVPAVTEADLLGISFAFGFIITALVYAIGKVSGCHIHPAVTLARGPRLLDRPVRRRRHRRIRHLGRVRRERRDVRHGTDTFRGRRLDLLLPAGRAGGSCRHGAFALRHPRH